MPVEFFTHSQPFKTLPNIAPDFGNDWMSNAHEISLPENSGYLPEASIIVWLLFLVLVFVACGCWAWYRFRQSRLYIRQAQAQLNLIEARLDLGHHHELAGIPGLLKQVAFSRWARTELVGLNAEEWLQFWRASSPTSPPSFIADLAYRKTSEVEAMTANQRRELIDWSRTWISAHHQYVGVSVAQLSGKAGNSVATQSEGAS
ncbi:MAG: DUF4381 domain-containing protein [Cellvibrionaceae bacterium]